MVSMMYSFSVCACTGLTSMPAGFVTSVNAIRTPLGRAGPTASLLLAGLIASLAGVDGGSDWLGAGPRVAQNAAARTTAMMGRPMSRRRGVIEEKSRLKA